MGKVPGMTESSNTKTSSPRKRVQDYTAEEKLEAVVEFRKRQDQPEAQGEFLRSRGLFAATVENCEREIRGMTQSKLRELATLSFFRANENLILCGKTGEGKTHLAMSIGRRLCQDNQSVAFLPVNLFFEEVLASRASGKYLGYQKKLRQTQVLVLDDFGLRSYTHEEAIALVDLLEARTKKGPVIVTSQVDPRGWKKLFEDPVIAEAIVDRLEHPSQKITLTGGSYREKLSKTNRRVAE